MFEIRNPNKKTQQFADNMKKIDPRVDVSKEGATLLIDTRDAISIDIDHDSQTRRNLPCQNGFTLIRSSGTIELHLNVKDQFISGKNPPLITAHHQTLTTSDEYLQAVIDSKRFWLS